LGQVDTALAPLAFVGRGALSFFATLWRVSRFSTSSIAATLASPRALVAALRAGLVVALRCALPVVLVLAPLGGMFVLQAVSLLRAFGVEAGLGGLVAIAIVRELAPGFAAVVVAMQGGAGIAAELAVMRVREELDALEVMGADPRTIVVGPRVIGALLATPLVNVLAIGAALVAALVVAAALGVARGPFVDEVLAALRPRDLLLSEAKCAVFGLVTGAVCATSGCFSERGPAGVGRAAHRGVVASVVLVLVGNYLINSAVLGLRAGSAP